MKSALAAALAGVALGASVAGAQPEPAALEPEPAAPRPLHAAVGLGVGALITGAGGQARTIGTAALDLFPGGGFRRWGLVAAARAARSPAGAQGLATLGVAYEAAASRPRLAVVLHGEAGLAWGPIRPVVGGGLEALLALVGPLGISLDATSHLVIDGTQGTRLVIATSLRFSLLR